MSKICLLQPEISKLRTALESGQLDMNELHDMPSEARGKLLRDLLGTDGGSFANGVFERKLLLKNQQKAMESWIEKMIDAPIPAKRDMLSRVSRLDKILSETDQEKFLSELAETKLGAKVTSEEANQLLTLAKDAKSKESMIGTDSRMEYGTAKRKFDNYMDDLKNPSNKMGFKDTVKQNIADIKNPLDVVKGIGGVSKSLKSAYDNSALLRQGYKTLLSSPKTWGKNAKSSFTDFWDTLVSKGENPMDTVMADVQSRANVEKYRKMNLALGADEFIPTTIQEKIPVIGKGFKASDNAYKGFLFRSRADLADIYLDQAKSIGIDTEDPEFLRGLGNYVNQQTGRGNLGKYERAGDALNNLFFSPRFLESQIETFSHVLTGGQGISKMFQVADKGQNFVRRKAAVQLGKITGVILGFHALNEAFNPGEGELDPRGTKFGKVKVGAGYNDVTGGLGSLVTFLSRIATGKSISATGTETDLKNPDYGGRTKADVVESYIRGKLAPIASTIYSLTIGNGKDAVGKEMTPLRTVSSLVAPIPVSSGIDTATGKDPLEYIGSQLLDIIGSASSRYDR